MTVACLAMISERVVVCVSGDTTINMHEMTVAEAVKFAAEIMQVAVYVECGISTKETAAEFFEALRD